MSKLTYIRCGDYDIPNLKPVSYTHLDVYKRQVIGNPLKLSPDFPPLHTGRATFTASGVPSVVFTSI